MLEVFAFGTVENISRLKRLTQAVTLSAAYASIVEFGDQSKLLDMLNAAYGFYVKVEPNFQDTWRDYTIQKLEDHAKHELLEIKRGDTRERRHHNALDLTALLAMLLAREIDMGGETGMLIDSVPSKPEV